MGMYTALSLGVELDIPQNGQVAELLRYMTGDLDELPKLALVDHDEANQSHPFFSCSRWNFMMRCDSYYFDWDTRFTLRWDPIANNYFLCGVSNLKNYGDEINQFLDWLRPFIHRSVAGYIGWTMYEEDEFPTILMLKCKKDGDRELVKLHVGELIRMIENGDSLLNQLMPGVGNCVVNVAQLNAQFMATDKLKKELSYE